MNFKKKKSAKLNEKNIVVDFINLVFSYNHDVVPHYGNIEDWKFNAQMTDMSNLFPHGNCESLVNQDLSKWDVSKVERIIIHFYYFNF